MQVVQLDVKMQKIFGNLDVKLLFIGKKRGQKNMKMVIKKLLLWCMVLLLILTMHPISASAATKKVNLKAPVIYNWKRTGDGRWMVSPADGAEYTITWKKVTGASGYQVKVTLLEEGKWNSYCVKTKKCSYSEVGSTIIQSKAKVRAYKIVNGKRKYGPWSKTKTSNLWYLDA